MSFFTGSPEKHERVSTLRKEQEPLYQQAVNAGLNKGAGGAFGTSADYYRDLLSDDSSTYNAMQAPEMRRFNEQIIPDISEQFAGMGAGGLTSSGFQNAAVNAGTDLSERLGAIRARLRSEGAQGLQNIGQTGLQNYSQDVMTQPGSQGFGQYVGPILGAAGTAIGGPLLGAAGGAVGNLASSWLSQSNKGQSSPYGGKPGGPGLSGGRR